MRAESKYNYRSLIRSFLIMGYIVIVLLISGLARAEVGVSSGPSDVLNFETEKSSAPSELGFVATVEADDLPLQ